MVNSEKIIEIRPVRFIPFDLGAAFDNQCRTLIHQYLDSHKRIILCEQSEKEKTLVSEKTIKFVVDADPGRRLVFDCFNDGYGMITLFDTPVSYELEAFSSQSFLQNRRTIHGLLLNFQHPVSGLIKHHLEGLRAILIKHSGKLRISASEGWQYHSLAYVMSIHFVEYKDGIKSKTDNAITVKLMRENVNFLYKLILILEPSFTGLIDTPTIEPDEASFLQPISEQSSLIDTTFFTDYLQKNIEMLTNYNSFASWENVLILGPINPNIIKDYVYLEKKLQHMWFMTYCLNDILDSYLNGKNFDADEVRNLRLETKLTIQRFEQMTDASLGYRYLKIIEALIVSSRLEKQIDQLELHLDLIREGIEFRVAKRQYTYQRTIELLLFLLTFLQAVGVAFGLGVFNSIWGYLVFSILLTIAIILFLLRRV